MSDELSQDLIVSAVPPKHAGKILLAWRRGAGKTLPPRQKKRALETEATASPPVPAVAAAPLGFAEARVIGNITLIDTEIARGTAALLESRESSLHYKQSAHNIQLALDAHLRGLAVKRAALHLAEVAEQAAELDLHIAEEALNGASTERNDVALSVVHQHTVVAAAEFQHKDLTKALRDSDASTAALADKIAALGARRDEQRAALSRLVGEARIGALLDEGAVAAMAKRMRELTVPFETAGVLTPAPPADIWGVGAALETLNDKCYVCNKALVLTLKPIQFACEHITCAACAKQLVLRGSVCGVCRAPIDASQAHYFVPRPVFDLSQ